MQIIIFLSVAEENSFSQAARKLHMTQPAVTKSILRLEQQLCLPLFRRTTRHVTLTPEGETLYRKWSPLLFSMEEALICAQQIHQEQNLYLKVGMTSTTNPYLYFWPIADKFKQLYPDIRLIVESDSMDILREKLENHEYDIVFLPHFEHYSLEKKELCWCWAAKDHVYAYMPDNHPLAGKTYLDLADLKNYGLVILDEAHNPNYIRDINELFSGENFKPQITKSIKNAYTIIASKRDIKDIIIADAYFDFAPSSSTVRIPVKDHFNGIICAYHRKNTSNALAKFLNIINKIKLK